MHNNRSRGFTLIKLLVVIAIIGVLASVVLASLNTARLKGNDASIQSNLSTIQTQAEIYYCNTDNSYGSAVNDGVCTTAGSMFDADVTIKRAIAALDVANGAGSTASCYTDGVLYAISSPLSTDSAKHWCVDNNGTVGVRV